ncbi:histidine kinase [beta proteobacterium AAP99]|nr:histidine kinase [beta proteobacterium AAP99]
MSEPLRRVILADDEPAVRDAIAFLLESRGLAVSAFESAEALLAWLDGAPRLETACFLLDVRMEGMSGLALQDALLARGLAHPIIFLTGHGDVPMAVDALKRGASDFLQKPYSDNTLVDRLEEALAADGQRHARAQRQQAEAGRLAALTPREREVMQLVAAGKLNKVIADELCISVRTVEVARARVFEKLGVRSAAEVATLLARSPQV